eukprot:Clim_evm19s146 gene=Clim_evmTU19s146
MTTDPPSYSTAAAAPAMELTLDREKCPIHNVTVYEERAEIRREVTISNEQLKDNDKIALVVKGVTSKLFKDSVRVNKGAGEFSLLEVSVSEIKRQTEDQEENPEEKPLLDKLAEINEKIAVTAEEEERVRANKNWLAGFAQNSQETKYDNKGRLPFSTDTINEVEGFMGKMMDMNQDLDGKIRYIHKQQKDLRKEQAEVSKELAKLRKQSSKFCYQIEIMLSVPETLQARNVKHGLDGITFQLVYMVQGAKWRASYDARYDSHEKSLQLAYYGEVTNDTHEDWEAVDIALSTAKASSGGEPPELGVLRIQEGHGYFGGVSKGATMVKKARPMAKASKMPMPMQSRSNVQQAQTSVFGFTAQQIQQTNAAPDDLMVQNMMQTEEIAQEAEEFADSFGEDDDTVISESLTGMGFSDAMQANRSVGSATFKIARRSTVLADAKERKVTVVLLNLNPTINFIVIPSKSDSAYIRADVVNDSSFALIAGPVSCFMDQNFVCKSRLKEAMPRDRFSVHLGITSDVTVKRLPVKVNTSRVGMITKSKVKTKEITTRVKYNGVEPTTIYVFQQLPESTDDRIKVTLMEPDVKSKHSGARLLKEKNHVEWAMPYTPGQSRDLRLAYNVECPVDLHWAEV